MVGQTPEDVRGEAKDGRDEAKGRGCAGQPLFGGAHPEDRAQKQAEIEAECRGEVALGEVFTAAQRCAAQSTVVEHECEAPLKMFTAFA